MNNTPGYFQNQLFDVNLKVKQSHETKEFDFVERNRKEVLMILGKIKEELK